MTAFLWRRRVEFAETDLAGIAHFSNFLRWAEAAEHALLRSLGAGSHDGGLGWPRVAVTCDYVAPLRFEDELEVELGVRSVGTSAVTYAFTISRVDGERRAACARGTMTSVCIARESRPMKPIPIPDDLRARLAAALAPT